MNEKLQYAEMLEIPISTCNITYKPPKKRLFRGKNSILEDVKVMLQRKVNQGAEAEDRQEQMQIADNQQIVSLGQSDDAPIVDGAQDGARSEELDSGDTMLDSVDSFAVPDDAQGETVSIRESKPKKKKKISIIGVQLVVIGALIATIFLTSALLPNSGLNTFFAGVFESEKATEIVQEDNRVYTDFTANLPTANLSDVVLEDGVMTFSAKGSVYAPCKGTVSAINQNEDGKFTLEITHNDNFKTVFNGIDYAYFNVGDMVYSTLPVGYLSGDTATACFYDAEGIITDYTIGESGVVWAV